MNTMLFKKTILVALIAALALASFPLMGVSASGQTDTQPPAQEKTISNERLERIWARMYCRYERFGRFLDRSDGLGRSEQDDRASQGGWRAHCGLETALEAFEDAVREVHPVYGSCKGIINSHKGFDPNGKVTDAEQAKETLKDLGAKFGEIHSTMDGTGRDLIE